MRLVRRSAGYDRTRLLDAAARARARKQRGRAIECYRRVLVMERGNPELHAKLAPLLAETGQDFDAWVGFQKAAQASLREGLVDRALAIYREAARYLPREPQVWLAIARLEQQRGRDRDALEALLEGSFQFQSRWRWPEAIHLLRRARKIEPWNFEVVFHLARLLAKTDQRYEAGLLLEALASGTSDDELRRVRGAQFLLRPGIQSAMRWIRAAFFAEAEDEDEDTEPEAEQPVRPPAAPVVALHGRTRRQG